MIDSEHSKRPMILSIKSVVRARDGSGSPLRERKHISYIFLLRGIRRLRIVLPISRNLRLKFPLKYTKIGRHCKQALCPKSWAAPEKKKAEGSREGFLNYSEHREVLSGSSEAAPLNRWKSASAVWRLSRAFSPGVTPCAKHATCRERRCILLD